MRTNYIRRIIYGLLALIGVGYCWYKEYYSVMGISGIVILVSEFFLKKFLEDGKNEASNPGWKDTLKSLIKNGDIGENDLIRISFAYLFRIKIDNKYFLVKNERGTQKYQPIGGAYKFFNKEKEYLQQNFFVIDDKGIKNDVKSKNDYRLYVRAKYLKKFLKRFDKTIYRERIDDLSRELKEELKIDGEATFDKISYRYCGRHLTDIEYSRYFACYELLLADIVDLVVNEEQEKYLKELVVNYPGQFILTTVEKIKSCGIEPGTNNLLENIADHSFKILQETEADLIKKVKGIKENYISIQI